MDGKQIPTDGQLEMLSRQLLLAAQQQSIEIVTVESCTGGLLASYLTDVEGLSHIFNRALITYCDEAKTELARVPSKLINEHGAVSSAVAQAMACGGRSTVKVDCLALAITGYAGSAPNGGPGGLVYIAASTPTGAQFDQFDFAGTDRDGTRRAAVQEALKLGLNILTK